jgi:phasin
MSPMSELDQSGKFSDKSAAIANETLAKGKAVAEQSAQAVEQIYSAAAGKMRDYNLKMIDMAQANAEGVFEFARQLAAAKSSSDLVELWTAHAKKQIVMLSEQIKEMTAVGQKMAAESAAPIARSVDQAFKKAS